MACLLEKANPLAQPSALAYNRFNAMGIYISHLQIVMSELSKKVGLSITI